MRVCRSAQDSRSAEVPRGTAKDQDSTRKRRGRASGISRRAWTGSAKAGRPVFLYGAGSAEGNVHFWTGRWRPFFPYTGACARRRLRFSKGSCARASCAGGRLVFLDGARSAGDGRLVFLDGIGKTWNQRASGAGGRRGLRDGVATRGFGVQFFWAELGRRRATSNFFWTGLRRGAHFP